MNFSFYIVICLLVIGFLSFLIGVTKEEQNKKKAILYFLQLITTLIMIYLTYKVGEKDGEKINHISATGDETNKFSKATNKITAEIERLSEINNSLSSNIHDITAKSSAIVAKSDSSMTQINAENALYGKLNLVTPKLITDKDKLVIKFGNSFVIHPQPYPKITTFHPIGIKREPMIFPMTVTIETGKLYFTYTAYDLNGNWVVDIDHNQWRRNPNTTGKFNYDSQGFEIIDNFGFTVLRVDLVQSQILLQGYYLEPISGFMLIAGSEGMFDLRRYEDNWYPLFSQKYIELKVSHLFNFSGAGWLHKRTKSSK